MQDAVRLHRRPASQGAPLFHAAPHSRSTICASKSASQQVSKSSLRQSCKAIAAQRSRCCKVERLLTHSSNPSHQLEPATRDAGTEDAISAAVVFFSIETRREECSYGDAQISRSMRYEYRKTGRSRPFKLSREFEFILWGGNDHKSKHYAARLN